MPAIDIVGGYLYPLPGLIIVTSVIFPSLITGDSTALSILSVPTVARSATVSTSTSYKLLAVVNIGSFNDNLLISLSSIIKFFVRTRFTRSITCFSASFLFLNQDCRGLLSDPYFSLSLSVGSGTILDCASYPIKLSNHFITTSGFGWLVSRPSLTI